MTVREVTVETPGVALPGLLGVPEEAVGLVLFAHGSGSSRLSRRNNAVAAELREAGLATVLFDLLTEEEALDRANVFDIGLLAGRLLAATDWAESRPEVSGFPIGYFGASTGAAAALAAAAERPEVGAVVSRGGRPDMAEAVLTRVTAPTLLIVGELDHQVLELNRRALELLAGEKALVVVSGAGHLFEEPGALEEVSRLATGWFLDHLRRKNPRSS